MIEAADRSSWWTSRPPAPRTDHGGQGLLGIAPPPRRQFLQGQQSHGAARTRLRLTAERVDKQLRDLREDRQISAIWRSGERLLVAGRRQPVLHPAHPLDPPHGYALDAPWIAVNVETPAPLTPEERKLLEENLALARELNAEIVVVPDRDVAGTLVRVAQQHNVSQIVIGKSRGSPVLDFLCGGSWPTGSSAAAARSTSMSCRRAADRAQPVAGMDRLFRVATP